MASHMPPFPRAIGTQRWSDTCRVATEASCTGAPDPFRDYRPQATAKGCEIGAKNASYEPSPCDPSYSHAGPFGGHPYVHLPNFSSDTPRVRMAS